MSVAAKLPTADRTPRFCPEEERDCQRWQCGHRACWNVWAGFYCYDDAIAAGWLPGAARRHGDQLSFDFGGAT